ncbi:uncharacterized protein VTP21DRAFT_4438 [Calcarisporiella thermophila]|uniref:uncharacterized protein n=1 Tax=Calcarisporiella thermophila TaxID=911321 RepID=UPI003741F51C
MATTAAAAKPYKSFASPKRRCSERKRVRQVGPYMLGRTIGKGSSGRVKIAVHISTGQTVAVKIVNKASLQGHTVLSRGIQKEIVIMKLIQHPHILSLYDVFENDHDLFLVMEYVEGGELFEYIVRRGRLQENEARAYFQQIVFGLDFCHRHHICHRDLKPENLLLDRFQNVKIADFGMASLQPSGSMLETSCGSPHYASPEIVAGIRYDGAASDIWSCGIILYALLTGHLPFDDENIKQLLQKVKAGKFYMPQNISESAQDLINHMLRVDPRERITMCEIIMHPWFTRLRPRNFFTLPKPPSPEDVGRPLEDIANIDESILESLRVLWSDRSEEELIRDLVEPKPNMQKVFYYLLQQFKNRVCQNGAVSQEELEYLASCGYRRVEGTPSPSVRNRRKLFNTDSAQLSQELQQLEIKTPAVSAKAIILPPPPAFVDKQIKEGQPTFAEMNIDKFFKSPVLPKKIPMVEMPTFWSPNLKRFSTSELIYSSRHVAPVPTKPTSIPVNDIFNGKQSLVNTDAPAAKTNPSIVACKEHAVFERRSMEKTVENMTVPESRISIESTATAVVPLKKSWFAGWLMFSRHKVNLSTPKKIPVLSNQGAMQADYLVNRFKTSEETWKVLTKILETLGVRVEHRLSFLKCKCDLVVLTNSQELKSKASCIKFKAELVRDRTSSFHPRVKFALTSGSSPAFKLLMTQVRDAWEAAS